MLRIFTHSTRNQLMATVKKLCTCYTNQPMNCPVDQQPDPDIVEAIVCNEDDIKENEMKQFAFDDESNILLIKQNGELSALGPKCTHYGAPLHTGALTVGHVRCPWHGACFNIKTGDIEDFPGLDSLPCYQVNVTNGKVQVRARKSQLQSSKRIRNMAKRDANNEQTFIVIGGGPSGGVCVETLRQEGFTGRIVLVSKENNLPYDRIKLSKAMDAELEKLQFRTSNFYEDNGIEVMVGVQATGVQTDTHTVMLDNGYQIKYDKLYIATGMQATKPKFPGVNLKNIFTVRDHTDAANIARLLTPQTHVICLGLGFIGMESAAYCVKKVAKVTVMGRDTVPFRKVFGPEIGQRIVRMFEENNVEFIFENGIKEFIGNDDGAITSVLLNDDRQMKCDICIMGTGTSCYTDFLKTSNIAMNDSGAIETDEYLRTNIPNVYAGGDVANAPVWSNNNVRASIGHYGLAQYHGRVAAQNMVKETSAPLRSVPFFWSLLFGKSFRYSGQGPYTDLIIDGSLDELKFVAFFYDSDGYVCAVASCNRDPIVAKFANFRAQGNKLHKSDMAEDLFAWTS